MSTKPLKFIWLFSRLTISTELEEKELKENPFSSFSSQRDWNQLNFTKCCASGSSPSSIEHSTTGACNVPGITLVIMSSGRTVSAGGRVIGCPARIRKGRTFVTIWTSH